jgi:ATP-dependent 26S proteasome regulatory subunit
VRKSAATAEKQNKQKTRPTHDPFPHLDCVSVLRAGYAKDHQPCVIFMDEVDAIGGRRFSEGTSADREIQRTLMELLNCLDGFDSLGAVKMIMATNRPDVLDPALLRPGRLDRKVQRFPPTRSVFLCRVLTLLVVRRSRSLSRTSRGG